VGADHAAVRRQDGQLAALAGVGRHRQRAEVAEVPGEAIEFRRQRCEAVHEVVAEVEIVLQHEDARVSGLASLSQHAHLAEETPAGAERREAGGLVGPDGIEEADGRRIGIDAHLEELGPHLRAAIAPRRQVDQVDLVEITHPGVAAHRQNSCRSPPEGQGVRLQYRASP
jgi:hypothetical protein